MGPKSFSKIGVLGSRSFFTMGGRSRQTSGIGKPTRKHRAPDNLSSLSALDWMAQAGVPACKFRRLAAVSLAGAGPNETNGAPGERRWRPKEVSVSPAELALPTACLIPPRYPSRQQVQRACPLAKAASMNKTSECPCEEMRTEYDAWREQTQRLAPPKLRGPARGRGPAVRGGGGYFTG
jgi:hypothetical protein